MSRSSVKAPAEIFYPESDGKPMGETGIHSKSNYNLLGTLDIYYRQRTDIYVTGDMFFYYEEGNPKAVKAPDLMVIKGVASNEERRTYKLWVEKLVPCVIFEFTSKSTRREDTVIKPDLYARLGVAEYFLFDPLCEYVTPQLKGFRLAGDRYVPIVPEADGKVYCLELSLKFQSDGYWVRVYNAATNQEIPLAFELGMLRDQQDEMLRTLRGDLGKNQKELDRERRKTAREARKAEAERLKAEALEAEIKRLRALLGERGIEG